MECFREAVKAGISNVGLQELRKIEFDRAVKTAPSHKNKGKDEGKSKKLISRCREGHQEGKVKRSGEAIAHEDTTMWALGACWAASLVGYSGSGSCVSCSLSSALLLLSVRSVR